MATRILVTGGAGYVGRFLIPALEQDGYHVVGVSRSSPLAMDVSSASDCERVLGEVRPDVIVHTAALSAPATCEKDPEAAFRSNVASALVEKAKATNPATRFIFLSTDQVYDGKGHLVTEEEDGRPVNVYGKTKLEMESVVRDAFPSHAILRLSFVYGPTVEGAHSTFLQFALDKLRSGEPFDAFTDQIRSCIYIDDVVDALRMAVQGRLTGLVNLGGPEALSRLDFVRAVARHVGVEEERARGSTYCLPTPSPADISMNISRLEAMMGRPPISLAAALTSMEAKL
ncbi:spsK [Symbiodinium natans]|uniref:SpsK protein n=1 Tax=Symbiodinium natans TaxID=878477 RepID=A0A812PBW0_9DINO|nr:spsK [Symbiodinium natans]